MLKNAHILIFSLIFYRLGAGAGYAGLHLAQTLSTFRASAGHRSLESGSEGEQTESKQLKNSSIISQDQGRDVVILTDLDNVCPLLSRNAARASQSQSHSQASKFSDSASGESQKSPESAQAFKMGEKVETRVRPLSWGDEEQSFKVLEELKVEKGEASSTSKEVNMDVNEDSWDRFQEHPLTHLILSDLVYFPELLPPLLRSVITLTDPVPKTFKSSLSPLHTSHSTPKSEETRTPPRNSAEPSSSPEDLSSKIPEVILAYKIRSFAKEEPFWRAFGSWFDFEAVGCTEKQDSSTSKGKDGKRWRRFGKEIKDLNPLKETSNSSIFEQPSTEQPEEEEKGDSIYVFIAKRKSTSIGYSAPSDDISLMSGKRLKRQANKFKEEGINKIDETSELGTEKSKGEGKGKEIEMEEFEIVDEGSGDFFELMLMGDMEV